MGELTDKAKGAAKQAVGGIKQQSGNPATRADGRAMEREGKRDKVKGAVKGALGDDI